MLKTICIFKTQKLRSCICRMSSQKSAKKSDRNAFTKRKELYGAEYPEKLLTKKQKTPDHMYLANAEAAQTMSELIEPFINELPAETVTALELNPGMGWFTQKLLDREQRFKRIILHESMDHFMPKLNELHALYPERVKVKHGDAVGLWKLAFQDKMDHGSRVTDLLSDVPVRGYKEG